MSLFTGGLRPFGLEQLRSFLCRFLYEKSQLWVCALDVDAQASAAKFLGGEWADRCDNHARKGLVQPLCLLHSPGHLEKMADLDRRCHEENVYIAMNDRFDGLLKWCKILGQRPLINVHQSNDGPPLV